MVRDLRKPYTWTKEERDAYILNERIPDGATLDTLVRVRRKVTFKGVRVL